MKIVFNMRSKHAKRDSNVWRQDGLRLLWSILSHYRGKTVHYYKKINLKILIRKKYALKFYDAQRYNITLWALSRNIFLDLFHIHCI